LEKRLERIRYVLSPAGRRVAIKEPVLRVHALSPQQFVSMMKVNFAFELPYCPIRPNASQHTQHAALNEISFPTAKLLEYRLGGLDYAIVSLGKDRYGRRPGDLFGYAPLAIANFDDACYPLYVAHHPSGSSKVVSHGWTNGTVNDRVYYHLDTLPGSSGAPVSSINDEVVAVDIAKLSYLRKQVCRFRG
jgi:hypothetical protein